MSLQTNSREIQDIKTSRFSTEELLRALRSHQHSNVAWIFSDEWYSQLGAKVFCFCVLFQQKQSHTNTLIVVTTWNIWPLLSMCAEAQKHRIRSGEYIRDSENLMKAALSIQNVWTVFWTEFRMGTQKKEIMLYLRENISTRFQLCLKTGKKEDKLDVLVSISLLLVVTAWEAASEQQLTSRTSVNSRQINPVCS